MIAEPHPAEPVRQPLGRARIVQLASYVLFAALPAITVVTLFVSTDRGRRGRVRLPRVLRRGRGRPRRRLALPGTRRRVGGRGARVRLPADHGDRGDPVHALAGRGRGSPRHGASRRCGARGPVGARRAGLALLRLAPPLAARSLRGSDGQRHDPPRTRCGARLALPRAYRLRAPSRSARRWRSS